MTKPEMIEAIRKACIKVNPEIMKLKFGCKILLKDEDHRGTGCIDTLCAYDERWNGLFFTGDDHASIYTDDIEEIIGRDIGLADVLFLLSPKNKNGELDGETNPPIDVTCGGLLLRNSYDASESLPFTEWNLTKPLHDQSEETIRFIFNLLKND